jgi:uncharacterized protein
MFRRDILKELVKWKDKKFRKPLVIRGARQVGKTTAIHLFAEQFDQYIYLNLEKEYTQLLKGWFIGKNLNLLLL